MTETRTLVLIPARMAATRLPGKPLLDIAGLPMIVHVLRRAEAAEIGRVAVATDTPEIAAAVTAHGGEAVMTRADHPSGSDRIYEALGTLDPEGEVETIVNVQGDLPTIPPTDIRAALAPLDDPAVDIATLAAEIRNEEETHQSERGEARSARRSVTGGCGRLYFTRATAPYGDGPRYHHIGLYAYRRAALERFVSLPPSALEQREKLEQLRALEAGMRIDVDHRRLRAARRRYAGTISKPPASYWRKAERLIQGARQRNDDQNHENRIPGRARRQFPYRHRRGLSRRRAVALPDLRGRAGRDHARAKPTSA